MDAKELRIGNLFQDDKGNLLEVDTIEQLNRGDFNIHFYVVDRSKFPLPSGYKSMPIPLTEEFCINQKWWSTTYRDNDNEGEMTFRVGNCIDITFTLEQNIYTCAQIFYEHEEICNFDFTVHGLQNLYRALTGKELELK